MSTSQASPRRIAVLEAGAVAVYDTPADLMAALDDLDLTRPGTTVARGA